MTPAELADAVRAAISSAVAAGELAVAVPDTVTVERPRSKEHGDYATNAALQLAKPARRPPREVASLLAARLRAVPGIADVDVAGPGFLNVRLELSAMGELARTIVGLGAAYGRSTTLAGQRLNLEFVSANPTGPIHIGGTRWAAVGDALARLLDASGARVTREYYFNDAGVQIDRFAESLDAAARCLPTPDAGYGGEYVAEIAEKVLAANPGLLDKDADARVDVFRREGVALMFEEIKSSLHDFGVDFDVYFSERTLHESGEVSAAIVRLREQGHVYDADGAVWLRTTDFGDDKDRVLVKSDGDTTYFTADAAYYLDKRERGYDRVIIMLGADHHGYVARMRAMVACFGDDPDDTLEITIGQFVNLVQDGEPVRMSKRAGTVITLDDLVDAVGVDAARYALVRASADSALDLDLNLLASHTADNPVWYVQYAHVRMASILRHAADLGLGVPDRDAVDVGLLAHPREHDLLRALGEYPRIVASAAELRGPHRLARYLEGDVAPAVQRFFDERDCRVLPRGDEEATPLTYARLLLCQATQTVLANGLGLLGVSAPERM